MTSARPKRGNGHIIGECISVPWVSVAVAERGMHSCCSWNPEWTLPENAKGSDPLKQVLYLEPEYQGCLMECHIPTPHPACSDQSMGEKIFFNRAHNKGRKGFQMNYETMTC